MFRMPDVFTELHSASKAVVLGVVAFLFASLAATDAAISARAMLIAAFLILTTPVSAHVIAQAAWRRGEPMRTPGALDESGRELPSGSAASASEAPAEDEAD